MYDDNTTNAVKGEIEVYFWVAIIYVEWYNYFSKAEYNILKGYTINLKKKPQKYHRKIYSQ